MKYLFLLSGENIELAKAEVLSLFSARKYDSYSNLLVIDSNSLLLANRLAYTNEVYRFLFTFKDIKQLTNFNWQSIYKGSFSVRIKQIKEKAGFSEAELAGYIWKSVNKPKVNLKNAKTKIIFFITPKINICCLLEKELKHDFEARKPHLRPGFNTCSLHPKLARALINLLGPNAKIVTDPFCGTGGLLIEAGLMGLSVEGYDINDVALKNCKLNLQHYKIKKFKILKRDALKLKKSDYVVADLPYGRSSKLYPKLYELFLKVLKKNLKKKAVIVFPDKANYRKLIISSHLKLKQEFSYYIHKSLTKKIAVIENG